MRNVLTNRDLVAELKSLRADRDHWRDKAIKYEARGDLGIGYYFGLSRTLSHFFSMLMRYDVVTREAAWQEMYAAKMKQPSPRIFEALASKLRSRLDVCGHEHIARAIHGRRGFGWWIDEEVKATIMAAYLKATGQ